MNPLFLFKLDKVIIRLNEWFTVKILRYAEKDSTVSMEIESNKFFIQFDLPKQEAIKFKEELEQRIKLEEERLCIKQNKN